MELPFCCCCWNIVIAISGNIASTTAFANGAAVLSVTVYMSYHYYCCQCHGHCHCRCDCYCYYCY